MAKNKSSEKPLYEMLYLISNKFSENELPAVVEKLEGIITKEGGVIKHREEWGKKKLAYPIKLFTHGYYNLAFFEVDGEKTRAIDQKIKIMSEVLRHQIVRSDQPSMDDWIKKSKEPREEKEERGAKIEKEQKETIFKKEKEEKPAEAADKANLDDKLDKILEGTDLLK